MERDHQERGLRCGSKDDEREDEATAQVRPEFRQYAKEMQVTFEQHLAKDDNHPEEPWNSFPVSWLQNRLMEEFLEWLFVTGRASDFRLRLTKRISEGWTHDGTQPGELKDVACFTLFICKALGKKEAVPQ